MLNVRKQGSGRTIKLAQEEVGRVLFKLVTQQGYVQAFMQAPPSLDEIFRMEVSENNALEQQKGE